MVEPTPKRARTRLAKAELWMYLAETAARWGREVADKDGGKPFAEWPADDPMALLAKTYALTGADLERLCDQIADETENRALRAGYGETIPSWLAAKPPPDAGRRGGSRQSAPPRPSIHGQRTTMTWAEPREKWDG